MSKIVRVALASSVVFLIVVNWSAIVATADNHPGLAGWAQAFGTVAAVVAALFSPAISSRYNRRELAQERIRRSRALAGTLWMPITSLAEDALSALKWLDRQKGVNPGSDALGFGLDRARLPIPVQLEFLHQSVADMDRSVVGGYLEVASLAMAHNSQISQWKATALADGIPDWDTIRISLSGNLSVLLGMLGAIGDQMGRKDWMENLYRRIPWDE